MTYAQILDKLNSLQLVVQLLSDNTIAVDRIYTVNDFPYTDVCNYILSLRYCGARQTAYLSDFATFDIETTTFLRSASVSSDDSPDYEAFMYQWQFCICDRVIMGRTWEEFSSLLSKLRTELGLSHSHYFVVYVHNLPFEFQFMRNFFTIDDVFALDKRKVVRCTVNDSFEFRCSYKLSNMSLSKFVSSTPNALYYKKAGDLDYKVIRTPSTLLHNFELSYCYNDVRGLREAIEYYLKSEHDTLASIPMTSTGYVRREFRAAFNSNPRNRSVFCNLQLDPYLYALLKTATRGGNCHCNPTMSGAVDDRNVFTDVSSYDMSSAYPAVMTQCRFPMTPFVRRTSKKSILDKLLTDPISDTDSDPKYALLIDCVFHDLEIKSLSTIPYIPKAKCTKLWEPRIDNGRVLTATFCGIVLTDIDFRIIQSQYTYSDIDIISIYSAKYDYLPLELREKIVEQYTSKCKLKFGDPYLYNKYKNKINADFGMMLTDICRKDIIYDPTSSDNPFTAERGDIDEKIAHYYKTRNSFLSYQWGVWVTAHCRRRLQAGIDATDIDMIYCDTDSVKFIGKHDADFEQLNFIILEEASKCQILTSCDVTDPSTLENHHYQLGIWEKEKTYATFKSLGAKKYAYTYPSDPHNLHITVAGLSKTKGAEWLSRHGGMDAFSTDTIIPAGSSGRTVSQYNDYTSPYTLSFHGEEIKTGSSIAIYDTSYTFGISSEYQELLADLEGVLI